MTNQGRLLGLPDRVAFPEPQSHFSMEMFQGGVTRLTWCYIVLYQIRAKFNFGGEFASFKVTIESHST